MLKSAMPIALQIEDALQDAKCALGIEPANMKAWARLGDSYMKLVSI